MKIIKTAIDRISNKTVLIAKALFLSILATGATSLAQTPPTNVSASYDALNGTILVSFTGTGNFYVVAAPGTTSPGCSLSAYGAMGASGQSSPIDLGRASVTPLTPGGTYSVSVCSYTSGDNPVYSAPVNTQVVIQGSSVPLPSAPSNLHVISSTSSTITVGWTPSSDPNVAGYYAQLTNPGSELPYGGCSSGAHVLSGGLGQASQTTLSLVSGLTTVVVCSYDVTGVSSPLVISTSAAPAVAVTGCQINLLSCPNYPSVVGSFLDNYLNAGSNPAECAQRASDYQNWCDATQPVSSEYLSNGVAQQITNLTTACQINVSACPAHPTVVGKFLDSYLNANTNPAECAQRASDYQNYCEATSPVTATFFSNGVAQQATDLASSCEINLKSCPNHPTVVGSFLDNYLNAGSNPAECAQRATDYQAFCDTTDPVNTTYYSNGVAQQATNLNTACQINVTVCPNYPSVVGSFLDYYLNANSNPNECEQRASDYEAWCGTTQPVTANYFSYSALAATKTVGGAPAPTPAPTPTPAPSKPSKPGPSKS